MKKFRKSPIAIICYIFGAIFAAYFVATEVNTISTIYDYYAPYQMTPTVGEVIGYMIQQGMQALTAAILVLMAGIILEEVRKLNPANWVTDDEIAEKKEARKAVREAKQIARGEAAKAAAEADMAEEKEGIKAEFAAAIAEEDDRTVVFEEETPEPEETSEEAAVIADEATEAAEAAEEPEQVFSDEFSAVIAEDVDEELAEELKTAVDKAGLK
jgi:hypothetical protein